ncbi:uncharacterized protein M6B38_335265 [Iris pallida]|uniref:Uncharacterized protein n=1 Tax=Iris pallida TaxID=29817 RepID=A0AAX6H1I4_IRIPA|nr:uncharacterized protein M6B38_335265 [Iris pallida]
MESPSPLAPPPETLWRHPSDELQPPREELSPPALFPSSGELCESLPYLNLNSPFPFSFLLLYELWFNFCLLG